MSSIFWVFSFLIIGVISVQGSPPAHRPTYYESKNEEDPQLKTMRGFVEGDTGKTDWMETAQNDIKKQLQDKYNFGEAKNVIFFLGDGMGITTTTASRIYQAQSRGLMGEDVKLAFERWPHVGFSMTYNTDRITPDSAGTASAFLCGEKAKRKTIGVSQKVIVGNCTSQNEEGAKLKSILKHAIDAGKATGIVSTARVTHATPAAAYASTAHRDWESDGEQATDPEFPLNEEEREQCSDIARQLVEDEYAQQIKVILGGGRQMFLPNTTKDPEYEDQTGTRWDNRDLIEEWKKQKLDMKRITEEQVKYVRRSEEFNDVKPEEVEYLLGLFEPSDMVYEAERQDPSVNKWPEPSISEMVEKAIKVLQKNDKGFLLIVEGAKIDKAHHKNWAMKALNETVAMSDAVQKAQELTKAEDTLIVVTADHSHVFAINGYPIINNDILGLSTSGKDADGNDIYDGSIEDGKPYSIVSYTNGPGYLYHRGQIGSETARKDLTDEAENINRENRDYQYDAAMYADYETHGAEDVAIYAHGPMSHLFLGIHEQNYIAHAMMYASCIGPNTDHCDGNRDYPMNCVVSSVAALKPGLLIFILMVFRMLMK